MSKLVSGDGRTHIESPLMRESLVDRVCWPAPRRGRARHLPDVFWSAWAASRSSTAAAPRWCRWPRRSPRPAPSWDTRMIIGVGGGTRRAPTILDRARSGPADRRHGAVVGAMEECNAIFLNTLLAQHGSITMRAITLGAAALPGQRQSCPRDQHPAVSLLGATARGGSLARARLRLRAVPACRGAGYAEDHLRQGRGRTVRRDPKNTPARGDTADRARRLLADLPAETILDRALFHTPGERRATCSGCRSSTDLSAAISPPRWPARRGHRQSSSEARGRDGRAQHAASRLGTAAMTGGRLDGLAYEPVAMDRTSRW